MYVVLSYDITSSRGTKIKQICDQYLIHAQKSVYEGEISEKKLNRLKQAVSSVITPEIDSVTIYYLDRFTEKRKEQIGCYLNTDLKYL